MSTDTVEIKAKSAGPEGATIAEGQAVRVRSTWKMRLVPFILEDYLDSLAAKEALNDPENTERIAWAQLKEQLGL